MFPNNMVYKGYRLTASVSRIAVAGSHRPAFTATVAVDLAGDGYPLPIHSWCRCSPRVVSCPRRSWRWMPPSTTGVNWSTAT